MVGQVDAAGLVTPTKLSAPLVRAAPNYSRDRLRWRRNYVIATVGADAVGVLVAGAIAQFLRFGGPGPDQLSVTVHASYLLVSVILAPLWVLTLVVTGVFDERRVGAGAEEYRCIVEAAVRFLALIAGGAFLLHLTFFSRLYVAFLVPLTPGLTLVVHWMARNRLHRRRAQGYCNQRTVVVGSESHVSELVRHLRSAPYVGLDVVGACLAVEAKEIVVDGRSVPIVATPETLIAWLRADNAEQVIVADATVLGAGAIRRFAWDLEGSGVDLIVAPTVTEFAGPRVGVRPVAGLPLLHVEEPCLRGVSRLVKGGMERTCALLFLIVFSPILLLIGAVIRLSSRGPALYRQVRVGKAGKPFAMYKFRTMVADAESQLEALRELNEADGPLFKIRRDPRITSVGRVLRRFSLDELPQLINVVRGTMSVVGPRPPLPQEIKGYSEEAWRRLLVRPGLTGLWQVSGRWELSWMESIRLDLYYIENWSLSLDVVITIKTFRAVLRDRGAG